MRHSRLDRWSFALLLAAMPAAPALAGGAAASGSASVSVSIKVDVNAKASTEAAAGDSAYAAAKFEVALVAYGQGFAKTRDAAFVYAMAQCHKALGHKDEAQAMFKMYLGASGQASLKYEAQAKGELGMTEKAGKGAIGAIGGVAASAEKSTAKLVGEVGAGVYGAVKVSISTSVSASAKASAKAGDDAYAAGKYDDAAKSYGEAFASSQQAVALYAMAQAHAQAGHAVEARGALVGYLVTQPSGTFAKDAKTLLLALGGHADLAAKVSVHAKVAADVERSRLPGHVA
jgi:tetratricopeptide (TPR) repeat protein